MHFLANALCLTAIVLPAAWPQAWITQTSGTQASLRSVHAVSARVAWASGAGGAWLRTVDGGAAWHTSVVPGAADLDFRAVQAVDENRAWLLSSGPGDKSRLYGTTDGGAHWKLLFTNPDAGGFLDALSFRDSRHGMILGDPVNGQFVLLTSQDGGETWQRRKTPAALPGEGAFAASNSCLVTQGASDAWFGTGGPSGARVFRSSDDGRTWQASPAPLRHDSAAAGIFSLAFDGSPHGIAVGGDYAKPAEETANFAVTADGGRSWSVPASGRPHGFRSAVLYLSSQHAWIAVGTSGSDISLDGREWKTFDHDSYNAVSGAAGKAVWAVGPGGRIARLRLD